MACDHLKVVANNDRRMDKLPATPIPSARGKEQQDQVGTHEFWDNTSITNHFFRSTWRSLPTSSANWKGLWMNPAKGLSAKRRVTSSAA